MACVDGSTFDDRAWASLVSSPAMSERVAGEIRRYLQERALVPGDRLGTEEQLAKIFGVSRPTLREALRLLSSNGLIRTAKGPGGGVFVARTMQQGMSQSVSDTIALLLQTRAVSVGELLDARTVLETQLSRLAALRSTEEDIEEIGAAVREARQQVERGEDLLTSDARFHRAIAAAAGNSILQAFMGWVFEVFQPMLIDIVRDDVDNGLIVAQHQGIFDAIVSSDPAEAEKAMASHLQYLREIARRCTDE